LGKIRTEAAQEGINAVGYIYGGGIEEGSRQILGKDDCSGIVNSFLGTGYLGVPDAEGGGGKFLGRLGVYV
jgi:hypothetical protein